jgi:uncharacterized membrane protein
MLQLPLAIVSVLLGAIFFSLQMVKRFKWAEKLSAVLWIIFTSALVSNLGLIPTQSPLYGQLIDFTVPFAVCVILFTVNLSDIRRAGRPMLVAFGLATLGTIVGVVVASLTLEPFLTDILGTNSWKLAGPYTGTYIGGSLNFFALWSGLELGNPDLLAAANAVDNVSLFPLYALWMILSSVLAGRYVVGKSWSVSTNSEVEVTAPKEKPRLDPLSVATLFFLALTVMAASNWIKSSIIDTYFPAVPAILVVTTLALLLGQLGPVRRLQGAWEIGDLAFYLFFASVGAMINFYQAIVLSPILFVYVMIILIFHMSVLYGLGWLLRMDVGVLTIASVATKAGPALIVPVAEAKGWRHLVLPGILIGMLGYAVGNYVGYAVAYLVRALI